MKTILSTFFKSTKGKIVAGTSGVAVTAAIVATIILMNQGFRTIVVDALTGSSIVTNNGKTAEAFVGQHLQDGDDVKVAPAADLTLFVDQDKYIYAEENAHFWLETKGKQDDTRTAIKQDAGSVLYRIDNKLNEGEYFNVNSSNASMSVRGTVFRITCEEDSVDKYTKIEVFEGAVYVEAKMENGDDTNQSRLLNAGEMAIIRSNDEISEFLEDEEQNVVRLIKYDSLPKGTALKLGTIIDSGRDVGITKELLFDYVEITEHKFVATDASLDPTHVLAGNLVEVCTICGLEKETEIPPLTEDEEAHKIVTETVDGTCDNPGYTITRCEDCGEIIEKTVTGEKKEHEFGKYEITKAATVDEEGEKVAVCADCGEKKVIKIDKLKPTPSASPKNNANKVTPSPSAAVSNNNLIANAKNGPSPSASVKPTIKPTPEPTPENNTSSSDSSSSSDDISSSDPCANGHDYVLKSSTDSTCALAGSELYECSRCKTTKTNSIAKKAHTYDEQNYDWSAATCTEPEKYIYECEICKARIEKEGDPALGHDFSGGDLIYVDDSNHAVRCGRIIADKQCNELSTAVSAHTLYSSPDTGLMWYEYDDEYHYNQCSDGCTNLDGSTATINMVKHTYNPGWDTIEKIHRYVCFDCNHQSSFTHSATWAVTERGTHILKCTEPGCTESISEHADGTGSGLGCPLCVG